MLYDRSSLHCLDARRTNQRTTRTTDRTFERSVSRAFFAHVMDFLKVVYARRNNELSTTDDSTLFLPPLYDCDDDDDDDTHTHTIETTDLPPQTTATTLFAPTIREYSNDIQARLSILHHCLHGPHRKSTPAEPAVA